LKKPDDQGEQSLQRARQVAAVWRWLPAFRAVAESEHLPTAAGLLHVSPSALSRTIRLLEEELGVPLFRREGGRISLNDEGQALLRAVRDAMRRVDDGLQSISGELMRGAVRVATGGLATHAFVLPALIALRRDYPALSFHLSSTPRDLAASLLRGELDVSFQSVPFAHPDLVTEDMGTHANAVFCGPGHPLYEAPSPTRDQILAHPFAAPPPDAHGQTFEGWPTGVPRTVVLQLWSIQQGLDVCGRGAMLAVLPAVLARADPRPLRALPFEGISPSQLLAIYRKNIGGSGPIEAVIAAVRAAVHAES
jgi:LysR family cyn operon transcriptional activator